MKSISIKSIFDLLLDLIVEFIKYKVVMYNFRSILNEIRAYC